MGFDVVANLGLQAALIAAGVPETTIAAWSVDPQVMVDGTMTSTSFLARFPA